MEKYLECILVKLPNIYRQYIRTIDFMNQREDSHNYTAIIWKKKKTRMHENVNVNVSLLYGSRTS